MIEITDLELIILARAFGIGLIRVCSYHEPENSLAENLKDNGLLELGLSEVRGGKGATFQINEYRITEKGVDYMYAGYSERLQKFVYSGE
jgi:hypothetical protein